MKISDMDDSHGTPRGGCWDRLDETQRARVEDLACHILLTISVVYGENMKLIRESGFDVDEHTCLWDCLPSQIRRALKGTI